MRDESRINWQQKLIDHGYFARSVPKEYGGYGGDMDIIKLRIIAEEFAKSPILSHGRPRNTNACPHIIVIGN